MPYTGFHGKEVWISKYCSDSREAQSHREKYLVNDLLLSGRYLDVHISPMTLPMDNDTKRFLHTLNIRGASRRDTFVTSRRNEPAKKTAGRRGAKFIASIGFVFN